MFTIAPIGQRDNQWKNVPLGTSTSTTIGSHGCTITSLAMLLNFYGYSETPVTVNKKLKDNGGYANTNLIVWTAIPKIWSRMKFVWRGYGYDNSQVSSNLPCLVEVDFDGTPRTDDRHWVLFKGDKKMNDPWTGTERATSDYSILTGYSVITGTQATNPEPPTGGDNMDMYKGIDLNNKESVKVAVDLWADVVQNNKTILTKSEIETLNAFKSRAEQLQRELDEKNTKYTKELVEKDVLYGKLSDEYQLLHDSVVQLQEKLESVGGLLTDAFGQLDLIKRVGYQSFKIPVEAWDQEKTILSHLTALSSSGNIENVSTTQLLGIIWGRFTRSLDRNSK